MTSNTKLIFIPNRWIPFLLFLRSRVPSFSLLLYLYEEERQCIGALDNKRTSIHRGPTSNLAFSSKPRNFDVHPVHAIVRPRR